MTLNKLTAVTTIVFISTVLTGCAVNKPAQFQVSVEGNETTENISEDTKQYIFTQTLRELHNTHTFRPDRAPNLEYSSPSYWHYHEISYEGLNAFYSYEFSLKNDQITMIDRSGFSKTRRDNPEEAYCGLCDDFGYIDYINQFQNLLSKEYQARLNWYGDFKAQYKSEEPEFKKKLSKVKVKVTDITSTLPKTVLKQISQNQIVAQNHSFKSVAEHAIESLYLPDVNESVRNALTINARPKSNKIERFTVHYSTDNYKEYYKDTPNVVNYDIDNVQFDFMPTLYAMSDRTINVSVDGSTMTIENKTNNYLNIESVSAYYNQNIETFKPETLNLPPKAVKTYKLNTQAQRSIHRNVIVHSSNQTVDYGFAIAYFNQDINVRKTLFKTKDYSLNSF